MKKLHKTTGVGLEGFFENNGLLLTLQQLHETQEYTLFLRSL